MDTPRVLTLKLTNPLSFTECWSAIPDAAERMGLDPDSIVGLWRRFKSRCPQTGEVTPGSKVERNVERPEILIPFVGSEVQAMMLAGWAVGRWKKTTFEIEDGEIPAWMLNNCSPMSSAPIALEEQTENG